MKINKMRRILPEIGLLLLSFTLLLAGATWGAESTAKPGKASAAQREMKTDQSEWNKLVEAAKKEGRLVIYASTIGDARPAISKAFTEKFGIPIEFVQGRGAELVQRINNERSRGVYQVDVGFQGLTTYFNQMQALNMTVPLEPMFVLPEVRDPTKWRGGQIPFVDKKRTVVAFVATAAPYVVINTELVKENEITSNDDLLAPKWKGKIVINDPSVAGNGAEWFSYIMLAAYDRPRAEAFMKKLVAQEPAVLRDQRLLIEWVARGKYPIAIASDQGETTKMIHAGAPVKFLKVKEGMPLTSGPVNVMVFDRAPHPNAAKLFVNWTLSREGMSVISPAAGYPAQRVDVANEKFDPILVPGPRDVVPGEEYKLQQGPLLKLAAETFKNLLQ